MTARRKFVTRFAANSMFNRFRKFGSCVVMPLGQRPVQHNPQEVQPIATRMAVLIDTASAPKAMISDLFFVLFYLSKKHPAYFLVYNVYPPQFDIDKKRFVNTATLVHNELTVVGHGNLM